MSQPRYQQNQDPPSTCTDSDAANPHDAAHLWAHRVDLDWLSQEDFERPRYLHNVRSHEGAGC